MSSINDQVTPAETSEILHLAAQCLALPGDFVELGCYRGDTSVLLGKLLVDNSAKSCVKPVDNPVENRRNRAKKTLAVSSEATPGFLTTKSAENSTNLCKFLWLYDSFAGLPEKSREDSSGAGQNFQQGALSVSKREVVEKLRRHGLKTASHPSSAAQNPDPAASTAATPTGTVIIKKAWFDDLTPADLPREIAFAFLDGDLYSSIKTSLRLVVPLLTKQGIIIVHDYNNPELPGAARAVDEFLRAHPNFRLTQKHTLAILAQVC